MIGETLETSPGSDPVRWGDVAASLKRPYPITIPMVLLMLIVPVYLIVPDFAIGPMNVPATALDGLIPLQPIWGLGYGTLYLFLILLPVLVVRERMHVSRMFLAYLAVWVASYVVFVVYPTEAPRPPEVTGGGFFAWGLRFLYDSDPPYNCFPSIHVAHSFVSALSVRRVHRGVGLAALVCAFAVALSTLFTKQHYVADVVAGIAMAFLADAVFLRRFAGMDLPERDRRVAPALALLAIAIVAFGNVCFWVVYMVSGAA